MDKADKTDKGEKERQTTRSGKEYGLTSKIIQEARFIVPDDSHLQRTISVTNLPRMVSTEATSNTGFLGSFWGSQKQIQEPNETTKTTSEAPTLKAKAAWEQYDASLFSSTLQPIEQAKMANDVASLKIQMEQITRLLTDMRTNATTTQVADKEPGHTYAKKHQEANVWKTHRETARFQSTETLASSKSEIPRRRDSPTHENEPITPRPERETEEQNRWSDEDAYDPYPDRRTYQSREWRRE